MGPPTESELAADAKFRPEQRKLRARQNLTMGGNQSDVVLDFTPRCLIDEQFAIVLPIGQVIDNDPNRDYAPPNLLATPIPIIAIEDGERMGGERGNTNRLVLRDFYNIEPTPRKKFDSVYCRAGYYEYWPKVVFL